MAIRADSRGFLLGERRIAEMTDGIVKTEDNTKQILKIITESMKNSAQTMEQAFTSSFEKKSRGGKSVNAGSSGMVNTAQRVRKSVDAAAQAIQTAERASDLAEQAIDTALDVVNKTAPRLKKKSKDAADGVAANSSGAPRGTPQRGADGRFLPKGGRDDSGAGSSSFFGRMEKYWKAFRGVDGMHGDVGGVDPTVDAVKELTSVVSPVGKVFWGMSAKAIGLIRGRIRKSKQDEILPQKQEEANKNEARSNKERNRLLLRLIDAVRGSSGGGDGGGLAGLLGGGKGGKGGKLGKLGKLLGRAGKRLPLLGALLGGGMLASEWGDLDKKGKAGGIGELLGGGVGGVAGAFVGGPAGAVAGGVAGAYLGKIFGEKVSVWVDEMRNEDFAGIFKRVVSDMFSTKANVTKSAFVPFSLPAMAMGWGAKVGTGVRNWASNTFGGGSSAGVTPYSSENFDYSNAAGNKNAAGNVASDRKARQLGMFNALRKVGIADDRALALVGQIGRENDFSDKMFSTHIDPAKDKKGKDIKNGGVLSWNGDRYKKFSAFMRERGLMNANGEMPKTQAALDAQAAFIKQEMGSSDYKGKMGKFHDGKKRDARDYAQELAAYIGWARGQDTIRGANGTRVSFDWLSQDKKANRYTDDTAELAKRQSDQIKAAEAPAKTMPNAKGKATAPVIFKPNAARPPAVKVPAITPEIAKIGRKDKPQVTAQNTGGIGQTVSDRGLAHILSGGLGYNGQNA